MQPSFHATGPADGVHRAYVRISSNTPFERTLAVLVTFTMSGNDSLFANGFEAVSTKN